MDILTRQEKRVAKLIAEEQSEKMIAEALFISPKTVPVHKKNIRKKWNVKTNVGIAIKYLQSLESPKQFVIRVLIIGLGLWSSLGAVERNHNRRPRKVSRVSRQARKTTYKMA